VALNTEFIGRSYPATEPYLVGREKIREFARSLGEASDLYFKVDAAIAAGFPDVIAPPTFAIVVSMGAGEQVIFDPELGLDYTRVVHGDQKFVHDRVITAGDQLTCTVTVDDIRSVAGNDMITVKTEIADALGLPVSTVYSMILSRGTDSP
jgi:acyl dehydratase